MDSSKDVILRLKAAGLSGEQIGQAIGRDRSLISQIARGIKPGRNLTDSLLELEATQISGIPVKEAGQWINQPARRLRKNGMLAGIREKQTHGGREWATTNLGKQAASRPSQRTTNRLHRQIQEADNAGHHAGITVTFSQGVDVISSSPRNDAECGEGICQLRIRAHEISRRMDRGTTLGDAIIDILIERGAIRGAAGQQDIETIELRTYKPKQ